MATRGGQEGACRVRVDPTPPVAEREGPQPGGDVSCAELVVVGVPDRVHGARIVALWAGDPSASSPDAALARAADDLPAPARPRSWLRVDSLPHTSAGKPDRAAARALASTRLREGA